MGINTKLYYDNPNPLEYFSIVPTSAITGEGMSDLLGYITWFNQKFLKKKIIKDPINFKASILEVKKIEGMGTTIDIILVNGTLNLDDKILCSG